MSQENELLRALDDRAHLLDRLQAELIGPDPQGEVVEGISAGAQFASLEEYKKPQKIRISESESEETLRLDPPSRRYGVGVLFPPREPLDGQDHAEIEDSEEVEFEEVPIDAESAIMTDQEIAVAAADDADFDLSRANEFQPSVIGLSFLCRVPPGSKLHIGLSAGTYRQVKVKALHKGREYDKNIWVRRAHKIVDTLSAHDLTGGLATRNLPDWHDKDSVAGGHLPSLQVGLEVFDRHQTELGEDIHLISVAFLNRTPAQSSQNATELACLFQVKLEVLASDGAEILPYPENRSKVQSADPEIRSFDLLYRLERTYGVGHGCAAGWRSQGDSINALFSESLPTHETPSITPDVTRRDGSKLQVPMAPLAGLVEGDDGLSLLSEVVEEYSSWIMERRIEVGSLSTQDQEAAEEHLQKCEEAKKRMQAGIDLLREDSSVLRAFTLMNEAMLNQQVWSRRKLRAVTMDKEKNRIVHVATEDPDLKDLTPTWRAFQIGFILAGLASTARPNDAERESVELIFFPTGGGKTEAYFALAAISMFLRRIGDPSDSGVDVIMRYTLRLLTTQQFLRAAALMCAMTLIARRERDLGGPFVIGIWLGSSTTPNKNADAIKSFRQLRKDPTKENPFLLLRCPHCATQIGPFKSVGKGFDSGLAGYIEHGKTVLFVCPSSECPFSKTSSPIPVSVIDEELYKNPPSLLLGTVDKFVQLAWKTESRKLFGISDTGVRTAAPPNLIIQDELHLISGPLGSMVGMFESVIEELCTDRRGTSVPKRPKIVTSTATIRRYEDQARALYGREKVLLFPPNGISAGDSFFARYARGADGTLEPGRMYVGVFAPSLGSGQTTLTRVLASLGQAAKDLPEESRDPWWTNLTFFNSMRELGAGRSLVQSDVGDYLNSMTIRNDTARDKQRSLSIVEELTSRLRSDAIPRAIEKLERTYGGKGVTDICLSSSIIEVGIDIDRLSLMTIVGQPKSTSQYIQVSGRVGRRPRERPGLVATIYSASKPRDRSHFERFHSYHQRLYAQVEPTSATPFAPPVIDRALHAAIVAGVRQSINQSSSPFPRPEDEFDAFAEVLRKRLEIVDPSEKEYFESVLARLVREWDQRTPSLWNTYGSYDDVPLLHPSGKFLPPGARGLTWETPTSMRDVDAECQVRITTTYNRERE